MIRHTIYFFVLALALIAGCKTNTGSSSDAHGKTKQVPAEAQAFIVFDTLVNDMGNIKEGEQLVTWYNYRNEGDAPLVIQDIKAGCGCTVPDWNNRPLEPGGEASIRVVFNSSGKKGIQNIRISVYTNASNAREDLFLKSIVEQNI